MPTGFGKTYNVFKFTYDNYKEFAAKNRKILFLTNLKNNLALKDLKNHFIENGNEDDYNKYVLFIDSNSETVIKNFIDIDDEIPDEFKNKESYKKLKKHIEICRNEKTTKEVKGDYEEKIFKET
jgi:lipoprotein NlpI